MGHEKSSRQHMIIVALVGVIFGMTVGYSMLSSFLNINGTSEITSNWDIHFTSIAESNLVDATTLQSEVVGNTSATFNVDLKKPGSSAEYTVTVKNAGTIDAKVSNIGGIDEINAVSPTDIEYSISEIAIGDTVMSGATKTFKVKVLWKSTSTTIVNTNKKATITLDFVQNA